MTKKMKVGKEPKPKSVLDALKKWDDYHKHKDDMKTVAVMMGPDFKVAIKQAKLQNRVIQVVFLLAG